ncbi:MAG: DNA-processing protein DprA [Endomicrobia bacterium]|nr:DNA-processing protein DprA [Endomicrobiia bacterium]MDW8055193.1 DNA-processing protein DprA [Elusimicrobiota bacterium]
MTKFNSGDELIALVTLNLIPNLGPLRIKRLIDYFGSATKIISAHEDELSSVEGIGNSIARNIVMYRQKTDMGEKEIQLASKNGVRIVTYLDDKYPPQLKYLPDAPVLIYIKGEIKDIDINSVAIVGTRKPTSYGKLAVEHLIKQFSKYKITIVSGLAHGIDAVAHECAIKYGLRTIAILGNGLGVYYPASNRKLQDKIPQYGALISEFPYYYRPNKTSFPQRNRIIAALSLGTIVIEADLQSGAMITAKFTADLGKDVFAVPGSIFSKQSRGTNFLIKTGAKLVTSAEDVMEEIGELSALLEQKFASKKTTDEKQVMEEISDDAKVIMEAIMLEPEGIHIDKLQSVTNMEMNRLMKAIFELEMANKIKELPGKIYILV